MVAPITDRTMRALRRRPALLCLALLALAMQAMLAFAQTHAHTHARLHTGTGIGTADLQSRAITYGACAAASERPCPAPARHNDDGQCDACWLIALAGSAVLQPPVSLPLLAQPYAPPQPIPTILVLRRDAAAPFHARGPPRA
jgi:hypothetical protein